MKYILGFSLILGILVAILVQHDSFMWGFITFISSTLLLVMDNYNNYYKFDYKG